MRVTRLAAWSYKGKQRPAALPDTCGVRIEAGRSRANSVGDPSRGESLYLPRWFRKREVRVGASRETDLSWGSHQKSVRPIGQRMRGMGQCAGRTPPSHGGY